MFNRKAYNKQYRAKNKVKAKTYREENKEEIKAYTKQWYAENREYHRKWNEENKQYMKLWRKKNKNKTRISSRKQWLNRFHFTEHQYQQMYLAQANCCAICKRHKDEVQRGLHIDHNHTSGKIRGLLCINCNTALGKLNDDIILFERAITYLKS